MKPDRYPLPWCDALGMPYWRINLWIIFSRRGWKEWQAGKAMAEIIPRIDALVERGEVVVMIDHARAGGEG